MSEGKKKINPAELAYSFFRGVGHREFDGEQKQVLVFWRQDYYLWESGVYRKLSIEEVKAKLVYHLTTEGISATRDLIEDIRLNLSSMCFLYDERVPNTWLTEKDRILMTMPAEAIVTNTRILEIKSDGTFVTKAHTPDFFALGKVRYDYDPSAECPRWEQFLDEVTAGNPELRRLLQQWAGYVLTSSQKYQTFLLLIGEAATGKGTYSRAVQRLVGAENCSAVPLRRFTDKFSLAMSYGKKLNVAGDAEEELGPKEEAVLKTWTGEDMLDYERKYYQGFSAKATAKLLILANSFPTFTDKSMGTWRRLMIAPFQRKDTSVIEQELEERLEKEAPGILNWALRGLRDLEESGGFVKPAVSTGIWEESKEGSNPAAVFLGAFYEFQPESIFGVPVQGAYQLYRKWCSANGYMHLNERNFGHEVKRFFPKMIRRRIGGDKTGRTYVYGGVALKKGVDLNI